MTPFYQAKAAVGQPVFVRTIGEGSLPNVMVARWRHNGAELEIDASDIVRVTVNLQNGVPIRHQTGDAASASYVAGVGSVNVMPAHTRTKIAIRDPADVLEVYLRESFLVAAAGGPFDCVALFNSHDVGLRAAAIQLVVAATRGEPDDLLLLEAGVHNLADAVSGLGGQPPKHSVGGLSRAAHRRVDELIRGSLDDATTPPPTLDELAGAACISVNHFIRAFRQQTGLTPHRYVMLRRLERAVALLKQPGMSVAEVAHGTSFATPSHFVAQFRRTMGVTPGAFRAAILG